MYFWNFQDLLITNLFADDDYSTSNYDDGSNFEDYNDYDGVPEIPETSENEDGKDRFLSFPLSNRQVNLLTLFYMGGGSN